MELITTATLPIIVACTTDRSALSAKKSMKTKMIPALRSSTIHSGVGITPFAAVGPVGSCALAVGPLIEPLAVGGLLGRRARLDRLQRAEHRNPPGVVAVGQGARLQLRPFLVYDGPRVADELTGEATAHRGGHELCRLELLRDDLSFGDRAAPRGVEALEREEDDEAEQHGEAGSEHAEDAGRAVAVLEVASLGCPPADEQHRRGCDDGDQHDDERRPEEIHRSQQPRKPSRPLHRPMRVKPAAEALGRLPQ